MVKFTIFFSLVSLFLLSCKTTTNQNDNTKKTSYNIDNQIQRINTLKTFVTFYSDVEDTEFDLFNVNGFNQRSTSIPGASSFNYKFVLKISPNNINKWTENFEKSDSISNINWTKKLIEKREQNWETKSNPEFYQRENEEVYLIVYRNEGIVFKQIIGN